MYLFIESMIETCLRFCCHNIWLNQYSTKNILESSRDYLILRTVFLTKGIPHKGFGRSAVLLDEDACQWEVFLFFDGYFILYWISFRTVWIKFMCTMNRTHFRRNSGTVVCATFLPKLKWGEWVNYASFFDHIFLTTSVLNTGCMILVNTVFCAQGKIVFQISLMINRPDSVFSADRLFTQN